MKDINTPTVSTRQHSNAYNILILILTIISLVLMVAMLSPLDDDTIALLQFYDSLICLIFLIDFFVNLKGSPKKSDYFIKERGWLDLLGSIPSFGSIFRFSGVLRLARLSRLVRIVRKLRRNEKGHLIRDVLENRSQYTAFITILLTIIILASSSVFVLQFESSSPDAKIVTGRDAFWYSIVTITTVGYGDYYPVTSGGRITAIFIMLAGIGIIAVLASLLSNLLMGSPSTPEPSTENALDLEMIEIKNELAAIRQLLENKTAQDEDR